MNDEVVEVPLSEMVRLRLMWLRTRIVHDHERTHPDAVMAAVKDILGDVARVKERG